jgi:Flp pilus assembly protein TadG
MTARARHRRWPLAGEGGSASLELAILAPVLLVLVALVVMGGRYAMASTAITGVAGAAARDASLARSPAAARAAAISSAQATLAEQDLHCQGSPRVQVDTSGFAAAPGTPASITVDVTCVVVVDGLDVPGLPGTRTLHERAVSPLDSYRSRTGGFTNSEGSTGSNPGVGR